MKRWIVATAAGVLVILVPLLVAASRSAYAPASPQAMSPFTPPLEVGKTYGFGVSGSDLTGKVLAEPRGNWLQVEVQDSGKVQAVWLNLLQVSYILPDPPAEKRGVCCQGDGTALRPPAVDASLPAAQRPL
jgi:hypothetical protein